MMHHPLRSALRLAAVAAACAPGLRAQDSVSKTSGLPGDAVNAYTAGEQLNDFVVDQTAFSSSWSKTFGIAPIAKSSEQFSPIPNGMSQAISAQGMSRRVATNVPFLRNSYSVWTGPGFGVNDDPARNDPGTPVSTVGATGFQFGFGFAEFGEGVPASTSLNNVIGGVVNFSANRPSRLFVSRIAAAIGGTNNGCALAAFGMGGVDEDGNIDFRADNNTTTNAGCPTFNPFTGNNLFRVRMAARTAMLNVLSDSFPTSSDALATDWLLVDSTVTHACPNIVPRSVAGRSILIGLNAAAPGQFVFESSVNTLTTAAGGAHLAGLSDHRGTNGYTTRNFVGLFPGSVSGTSGVIAKGSGALVDNLAVWGLDANGGLLSPRALPLPAVVTDPDQPWNNTLQPGSQGFDHYHGTNLFRAAPSQIGLGRDQAGNLLAAAVVYYGGVNNLDPNCYIAVSKTDPVSGATSWTVAAWTQNVASGYGKNIYQNGTSVIGTLKPFGVPGSGTGPTMSAPMIDSVGNVWFVGPFELASAAGVTQVGLFRAVYQPGTFSYKLELVLKQGDVFPGRNSGRNYQVAFIPLNYSITVSPSAPWSGNIAESAFQNQSVTGLSTSDAATLGGLVFEATIVYDRNGDGQFVPSSTTVGSPDEDYRVLLYVGASADCNANGLPDDADIAAGTEQDVNNNGIPDSCEGILGTPFCFGDGTGAACPCGNNAAPGSGTGCLSSLGVGARIAATGHPNLSNDTIVLHGTGMPNSSALYFQGTTQQSGGAGAVFGDGKRCASGSIVRLGTTLNVGNASQYPFGTAPSVSVKGQIVAPGTRTYQVWYRNAAVFCTPSTFNLSNGLELTWAP